SEARTLCLFRNGEPTDEKGRHVRIAGQFPGQVLRQLMETSRRSVDRVVSDDTIRTGHRRHIDGTGPAFDVLARQALQVVVQNLDPAVEAGTVVGPREDPDAPVAHGATFV